MADGRRVVSFGGCNYLALANHPAVVRAVRDGLDRFGLSSTASRETTGNAAPHELLEHGLADFLRVERVLLVPDGYLANIAACQGLARSGLSCAIIDERGHPSLVDAARTAGLGVGTFAHADPRSLVRALDALRPGRVVVMTDGVFTADGEPAPIADLLEALGPADRLLVDDCHGLGVLGPAGRGSVPHAGVHDPRIVVTSSLAKGIGCAGGIVAGTETDIDHCRAASAYICTTPIAPAMAQGTRAALRVLIAEPARLDRLRDNTARVRAGLHNLTVLAKGNLWNTPIAAFTLGDLATMERTEKELLDAGYRVPLIRYPGGPAEAYFRLSVNAEHTDTQINGFLRAFRAILAHRPTTVTARVRQEVADGLA
ncbi:MAG: pyridoxal phosphate-dependent aminotransferase family protein [Planctomycetota bacterium]|nr:pyridoxal phosphate-dependent aminotransferase family protein [Planctomycetota bacterium]